MHAIAGGCRCGQVAVQLQTAHAPAALQPRACDCSFCQGHDAAWISDPRARLVVEAAGPASLRIDRQGSRSAQFLSCSACGALVAVAYVDPAPVAGAPRVLAAVNATCLAPAEPFPAPLPVSPAQLPPEARRERWRQLWIAEVVLPVALA